MRPLGSPDAGGGPLFLPPTAICEALVGGDRGRRPGHPGDRAPARTDRRRRRHRADAAGTAAPGAGHHTLSQHPDSAQALWHALDPDASELTSYLVSFLVIAQFWMVHHRVLRGMRGHSEGLAWRNFGFLLALTLMPFTSDLIGRYGTNPVAITLFGLNLVAISLSTQWIFLYAAHHDLLLDVARSKQDERTARLRVLFVIGIVALSMALAWTAPQWAKFVWLLFLVVSSGGRADQPPGRTPSVVLARRERGTEQGRQGVTRRDTRWPARPVRVTRLPSARMTSPKWRPARPA